MITQKLFTVEDYYTIIEKVGNQFEFADGMIYSVHSSEALPAEVIQQMLQPDFDENNLTYELPTPTIQHSKIISNLHGYLGMILKDKPYEVYSNSIHVFISLTRKYRIPDVVVSKKMQENLNERDELLNPLIAIEVLSHSTENKDRTEKLKEYLHISELEEYMMVSQTQLLIEHYSRNDSKKWTYQVYDLPQEIIELKAVDVKFLLQEVYKNVKFETKK